MKIIGMDGMSTLELNLALQQGAKFVYFRYCVSVLILTFRRSSDIYLIRAGESTFLKSLPFTLLSFVVGWWGIPWGIIYTIDAIALNLRGGKDVTQDVIDSMNQPSA